MAHLSYRRHRFPPPIIQHAIWLYLRFTLSYRDVEELLAERGLDMRRHAPPKPWPIARFRLGGKRRSLAIRPRVGYRLDLPPFPTFPSTGIGYQRLHSRG